MEVFILLCDCYLGLGLGSIGFSFQLTLGLGLVLVPDNYGLWFPLVSLLGRGLGFENLFIFQNNASF